MIPKHKLYESTEQFPCHPALLPLTSRGLGAWKCPLCMNPRTSKGKPLVMVPAAAFLCAKPTIHPSLKLKNLTVLEDSGSVSISPQDFMAPFGSLTLNITDQTGNEANMICSIQKPAMTSSIAFTAENDYIMLNASFSTFLVCDIDYSHIQPVWQVLALYSGEFRYLGL